MHSQYEILKTLGEINKMLKKSIFLALASMASFLILSLPGCGGGDSIFTIAPSTAKSMTSFSFAGYTGAAGVIDETAKTIAVTVPFGTDVTTLVRDLHQHRSECQSGIDHTDQRCNGQ